MRSWFMAFVNEARSASRPQQLPTFGSAISFLSTFRVFRRPGVLAKVATSTEVHLVVEEDDLRSFAVVAAGAGGGAAAGGGGGSGTVEDSITAPMGSLSVGTTSDATRSTAKKPQRAPSGFGTPTS